jgi:hypothetical protein
MRQLTQEMWIDSGGYGSVYRISPRRVIKIFNIVNEEGEYDTPDDVEFWLEDEEHGASLSDYALPILRRETVIGTDGNQWTGLVKRYLPHECNKKDFITIRQLEKKLPEELQWDAYGRNWMKDSRGNYYLVDTQTTEV